MIMKKKDPTARHYFLRDDREGYHLLFVNDDIVNGPAPFAPLWIHTSGNAETLRAMARWVAVRQDRWEAWAKLRAVIGQAGFDAHIRSLIDAEPPERILGTVLKRSDDPRAIELGQLLRGRNGVRDEILIQHAFGSAELRERFWGWVHSDGNHAMVEAVLQIAWSKGADAAGEILDDLARKASAEARGRSRGGQTPRRGAA